jgi:hypothetical protein
MLQSSLSVALGRVLIPKRLTLNVLNSQRTMIVKLPRVVYYLIGDIFIEGFSGARTYHKPSSMSQQLLPFKHHSRLVYPLYLTTAVIQTILSCLKLSLIQHRHLIPTNP